MLNIGIHQCRKGVWMKYVLYKLYKKNNYTKTNSRAIKCFKPSSNPFKQVILYLAFHCSRGSIGLWWAQQKVHVTVQQQDFFFFLLIQMRHLFFPLKWVRDAITYHDSSTLSICIKPFFWAMEYVFMYAAIKTSIEFLIALAQSDSDKWFLSSIPLGSCRGHWYSWMMSLQIGCHAFRATMPTSLSMFCPPPFLQHHFIGKPKYSHPCDLKDAGAFHCISNI